ncbi:hypothetical protein AAFC00_001969 [Neodothiora populina]|uniref:Tyrosinase copper-binding domain-containing protein n=1 Tax=Neodothiora populina TaxID=2781224 RepID=A0ABR3PQT1_9PEZI
MLRYWDWSLDWESLVDSPVLDVSTGFGGDGDPNGAKTVGSGRCVIDGPFANLRPLYYNMNDNPHCLSRGFWDGQELGRLPGSDVSPRAIEAILSQADYESFFLALEHGPHNVIPNSIRGDFLKFTAPSDPLFFLHHTQLDRIWWLWQNRHPTQRLTEYTGNSTHNAKRKADLHDVLRVGPIGPDIQVKEVMHTRGQMLCYMY